MVKESKSPTWCAALGGGKLSSVGAIEWRERVAGLTNRLIHRVISTEYGLFKRRSVNLPDFRGRSRPRLYGLDDVDVELLDGG